MTQGKHPDRYVIREISGYGVAVVGGVQAQGTSIYIMDTHYGFNLVAKWEPPRSGPQRLEQRRREEEARLELMNEEHRRWIHGGRWSKVPPMQAAMVGEDAQAREGTAS